MKPLGITFGVNSSYLKHNTQGDEKWERKESIFMITDVVKFADIQIKLL
jgi:hypothetical protein